jgi:hypothetical protein
MAPLSSGLAPVWSPHCTPIFMVLDVTNGDIETPLNTPGIRGRRALPAGRLARLGATPAFHHGLLSHSDVLHGRHIAVTRQRELERGS